MTGQEIIDFIHLNEMEDSEVWIRVDYEKYDVTNAEIEDGKIFIYPED